MAVKVSSLCKRYGNEVIFDNFTFTAETGKITAILGGSGVGKSTLLNSIADLEPYNGNIEIDEKHFSYVFHDSALVKGLSVYDNLALVLPKSVKDKSLRDKIIMGALEDVELTKYANAFPSALSAGMAQRVSIARAFIVGADIILMDEPFRGLDVGVKNRLINNFVNVWQKHGQTVIFVTHAIEEALLLADKIVILKERPVIIEREIDINISQSQRSMEDVNISRTYADCFAALTKD